MFGDGSDGALNVTSGTHNLPLNTKHQFTTVNIASGATLSTNSTTGAVLYITARESITIDGKIDVSNKVNRGNNTWAVTIDGVSYQSPGVANGDFFSNVGQNGTGFGAGGIGSGIGTGFGGDASKDGVSPSGGGGGYRVSNTNQSGYAAGSAGSSSGGGGGGAWAEFTRTSGTVTGTATAQGGAGANVHGGNGNDGSGSWATTGGSGGYSYGWFAGGGGGGGGLAGRAGVHVVLKAPVIVFSGQIITAGGNGGNGGNGGRARSHWGWENYWGGAGLGGGGGNGGNITLIYADDDITNTGSQNRSGGQGGTAGYGGPDNTQVASKGSSGVSGTAYAQSITDPSLYPTTLSPTGIASSVALGVPTVTPEVVPIVATGIPSASALGKPHFTMYASDAGGIGPEVALGDPVLTQSPPPPPPPTDWSAVGKQDEKIYVYKVYKSDGTFVGVWVDVADDLEFTERINSPGTTTAIRLARSANTLREIRDNLVTESGDPIATEDGDNLVVVSQTSNTVGEDTDVELNYNVDIYVQYGEFAELTTQDGQTITTEDGDPILVVSGAPLGTRVFSGYVLDYDASYGDESAVWVTLASHGNELSDHPVVNGDNTTVTYSSQELATTLKAVLDINTGQIHYSAASIANTGVSQTMKFQLNTKLEAIQAVHAQTPAGWWWRGDVADNSIYLQPLSTGYDHTFVLGWHLKTVRIKRSMEGLKNLVYFVGGQTDPDNVATTKFKKYEDTVSQAAWRVGLERITDRRYTIDASMQARADKVLDTFDSPVFTTTVTITSGRYDIESIRVGQTVGFKNFGNYIDGVPPMQIVSRRYTPTAVTLELGALLDRQVDTLANTEKALNNEAYQNLPIAPS